MTSTRTTVAAILSLFFAVYPLQAKAGGDYQNESNLVHPFAIFGGVDGVEASVEAYQGVMFAFNRDLDRDGFMFRALGTVGKFEYDDSGRLIDGTFKQGDVMFGYQIVRNATTLGAYIGVDIQDYALSPDDATNVLRGTETGFKVAIDYGFERYKKTPYHVAVRGSYSTAFDTYYALMRFGHNLGERVYGIEGIFLGDASGNAQRLGAYALFDFDKKGKYPGTLSASLGYQFVEDANNPAGDNFGEESAYFSLKYTAAIGRERE